MGMQIKQFITITYYYYYYYDDDDDYYYCTSVISIIPSTQLCLETKWRSN